MRWRNISTGASKTEVTMLEKTAEPAETTAVWAPESMPAAWAQSGVQVLGQRREHQLEEQVLCMQRCSSREDGLMVWSLLLAQI